MNRAVVVLGGLLGVSLLGHAAAFLCRTDPEGVPVAAGPQPSEARPVSKPESRTPSDRPHGDPTGGRSDGTAAAAEIESLRREVAELKAALAVREKAPPSSENAADPESSPEQSRFISFMADLGTLHLVDEEQGETSAKRFLDVTAGYLKFDGEKRARLEGAAQAARDQAQTALQDYEREAKAVSSRKLLPEARRALWGEISRRYREQSRAAMEPVLQLLTPDDPAHKRFSDNIDAWGRHLLRNGPAPSR